MSTNNKLFELAKETRDYCEYIQWKYPHHFYSSELDGCCAIASTYLFLQLKQNKMHAALICQPINTEFHHGHHCYILHKDKIIDVTATQFENKLPEINILPFKNANKSFWGFGKIHKSTQVAGTIEEIKRIIPFKIWKEQCFFDEHGNQQYPIKNNLTS